MAAELAILLSPVLDAVVHYKGEANWRVTFRTGTRPRSTLSLDTGELEHLLQFLPPEASGEARRTTEGRNHEAEENTPDRSDAGIPCVDVRPGLSAQVYLNETPPLIRFTAPSYVLDIALRDFFTVIKTVEFLQTHPAFLANLGKRQ